MINCPVCRSTPFDSMLDKKTRGQILSQKVKCKNAPCEWTGELLDLDRHAQSNCQYAIIQCPLGCGKMVARINLSEHEQMLCSSRSIGTKLIGLQRMVLTKVMESGGRNHDNTSIANLLLPSFQNFFTKQQTDIGDQIETRSESESSMEEKLSKINGDINNKFEQHEARLTGLSSVVDNPSSTVPEEVKSIVMTTTDDHDKSMEHIELTIKKMKQDYNQREEQSKGIKLLIIMLLL